jgi:hypothetical protein
MSPQSPVPAVSPWVSSLSAVEPDTLEESGGFATGRAGIVIPQPVPGEEAAEPAGSGSWLAGRIALIAATVIVLAGAVVGIGKATLWSAGDAVTTSSPPSVTTAPLASPSAVPTEPTSTPTPQPTATAKSTAPRTTAPATSPFFTPELKTFGAGWQPGWRCQSHHAEPARAIDASSCSLSPSAIPDVTKSPSRSVTASLEQFLPGAADDHMGCTPAYTIPGMASGKVDQPGTSGNRAGFYCETTGNLTDDGNVIGMCTYIMWTSGDMKMLGMLYECFRFSDEGTSFRPTPAMLSYLRSLWNARA